MATFLKICQDANTLSGLQGSIADLANVTGYQAILVKYVEQAYKDIQNLRDEWDWLKTSVTISLSTVLNSYSTLTDVSKWDTNRIEYDDSPLKSVPEFYYTQQKIDEGTASAPSVVSVFDNNELHFNPLDANYTVDAYYWKKAETLSGNTDVPLLPSEFHDLIIYKSVAEFAAGITGNSNIYTLNATKGEHLLGKLMRNSNPAKRVNLRGLV